MRRLSKEVVVVGGGPAGLSAALVLGRAMKSVLLCDAGTRRNAAAEHMHGFVTRDGIPPAEFRAIGREQLRPYGVTVQDVGVHRIEPLGTDGFEVTLVDGVKVTCRRVLLATGMVDEIPDVPGIRALWGRSIFQCPYCHGWELRGRSWGILATQLAHLEFGIFLTGWAPSVVAFTNGPLDLTLDVRRRLERAGVRLEPRRIRRLIPGDAQQLKAVELEDGERVERDVLVVRPPQRQIALVAGMGLALDEQGFVRVNGHDETSLPGVYAAGDLTSPMQGALLAAAAGARAAYALNHALNVERAERPVVFEAYVDPDVPPLPPHTTFEQARHFAESLLSGDEGTGGVVKQSLKGLVDKLIPHKE